MIRRGCASRVPAFLEGRNREMITNKWHDLTKNPEDLPKTTDDVWVILADNQNDVTVDSYDENRKGQETNEPIINDEGKITGYEKYDGSGWWEFPRPGTITHWMYMEVPEPPTKDQKDPATKLSEQIIEEVQKNELCIIGILSDRKKSKDNAHMMWITHGTDSQSQGEIAEILKVYKKIVADASDEEFANFILYKTMQKVMKGEEDCKIKPLDFSEYIAGIMAKGEEKND